MADDKVVTKVVTIPLSKVAAELAEKHEMSKKASAMSRRELVNAVATQSGLSSKEIDGVLKDFQDVVTTVVASGTTVNMSGFCKFVKVDRPARMGRNPATGEAIKIKASKKVAFRAAKELKEAV